MARLSSISSLKFESFWRNLFWKWFEKYRFTLYFEQILIIIFIVIIIYIFIMNNSTTNFVDSFW